MRTRVFEPKKYSSILRSQQPPTLSLEFKLDYRSVVTCHADVTRLKLVYISQTLFIRDITLSAEIQPCKSSLARMSFTFEPVKWCSSILQCARADSVLSKEVSVSFNSH